MYTDGCNDDIIRTTKEYRALSDYYEILYSLDLKK